LEGEGGSTPRPGLFTLGKDLKDLAPII
jgi:hypothetical protein